MRSKDNRPSDDGHTTHTNEPFAGTPAWVDLNKIIPPDLADRIGSLLPEGTEIMRSGGWIDRARAAHDEAAAMLEESGLYGRYLHQELIDDVTQAVGFEQLSLMLGRLGQHPDSTNSEAGDAKLDAWLEGGGPARSPAKGGNVATFSDDTRDVDTDAAASVSTPESPRASAVRRAGGHIADARRAISAAEQALAHGPTPAAVLECLDIARAAIDWIDGPGLTGRRHDAYERVMTLWDLHEILDDRDWEHLAYNLCCLTDGYRRAAAESYPVEIRGDCR